jgi:hypothetical protein
MNSKQQKVLALVYKDPIPKSLEWMQIENLLLAVGVELIEGNGSRVRFHKEGIVATFHRPHPKKEAKPYQIKDARNFLIQLGIKP